MPDSIETTDMSTVEWRIDDVPVAYDDALAVMERRVEAIRAGTAS